MNQRELPGSGGQLMARLRKALTTMVTALLGQRPVNALREVLRRRQFDEVRFLERILIAPGVPGTMIDVGACHGSALQMFLQKGWTIYAFEPDPVNRATLMARFGSYRSLSVDSRAVSNAIEIGVPFYSSRVSVGISTLRPFHDSHQPSTSVSTTTLQAFCEQRRIGSVDFLKIDTEGHDLMVLEGFDWSKILPRVVLCEFEDRKTRLHGYVWDDMAKYLVERKYMVLVSEWRPVVEYGRRHEWHRAKPYPCDLDAPDAWGNLVALRDVADFESLSLLLTKK